jgi:hypothetical protein
MAGRTLTVYLAADTSKFKQGMTQAGDAADGPEGLRGRIGNLGNTMSSMLGPAMIAGGAAAGAFAIKLGVDAVQAAGDLNEALSKSQVIFGDVADEIVKFSETANEKLGQTQEEAVNAASTFAQFGKAAGLAGEDLVDFSLEFVNLATDLASFNNTSVDTAVVALGAALRGESEPMRQFGVLLDDATLKAKALELGIYDGNGVLTAQQKILAAHAVILEQTGDATGDFERTSTSLNNQTKIINASINDLKTSFGTGLLDAVMATDLAAGGEGLTGTLQEMKKPVKELGTTVGEFAGSVGEVATMAVDAKDALDGFYDSLGPVGEAAKELTGILSGGMLNVITKISGAADSAADAIRRLVGADQDIRAVAASAGNLGVWSNRALQ